MARALNSEHPVVRDVASSDHAFDMPWSKVGKLKLKPLIYLVLSLLLLVPGVFLTVEGRL